MAHPNIVPVNIPLDRLAVAAYLSYAVTVLKATGKLDPDTPPERQVTPFAELPEETRAGWIAAAQGVVSNGGAAFAMKNPIEVAYELGAIAVDEIARQYPIRQVPSEIRFPSKADEAALKMWARVTARALGAARITVPAAIAKGQLKGILNPRALTAEEQERYGVDGIPSGAVLIPAGCFDALIASGFTDGERVTIAIMDPSWNRDLPDGILEPTEGEPN